MLPFRPIPASTTTIVATTTSGSAAIAGEPSGAAAGWIQVRLVNTGGSTAYMEFGAATVVATVAASLPLPAGAVEVLTIDAKLCPYMAVITSSSTTSVSVTPGDGV